MKNFDLNKFNKYKEIYCKKMAPSTMDIVLILVSVFFVCLFYSLEQNFNLDFSVVGGLCASIFFAEGMYCLCWFACIVVFAIMQKFIDKKQPQESEKVDEDK